MKRLLLLGLFSGWLTGLCPAAAEGTLRAAPDGERFLFIVDISSAMRRIEAANRQTVFDLISSGVSGQMRTGDTYGVWTFNEETYVGQFPMQIWGSDQSLEQAGRAALFLRNQKYAKTAHIDQMVLSLRSVVKYVRDVTVFILSDGATQMVGTPYDEQINTAFEALGKDRSRAKKPFVTALVAREGKIVSGSVTIAGNPIQLPPRPRPVLPRLPTNSPPVRAMAANAPLSAKPQTIPTQNASTETPTLSIGGSSTARTNTQAGETVGATSALSSTSEPPRRKIIQIVTKADRTPSPGDALNVTATNSELTKAETTSTAAMGASNSTITTASSEIDPQAPAENAVSHPSASLLLVTSAPPPVAELSGEAALALESLPPGPLSVAAREISTNGIAKQPPGLTATAVPSSAGLGGGVMLAIGGVLLGLAVLLFLVLIRRVQPAPRVSFITQSMERQ